MPNSRLEKARNNRANQLNPNNDAYLKSRGVPVKQVKGAAILDKPGRDNRANQGNPNNPEFKGLRPEKVAARPVEPSASSSTKT